VENPTGVGTIRGLWLEDVQPNSLLARLQGAASGVGSADSSVDGKRVGGGTREAGSTAGRGKTPEGERQEGMGSFVAGNGCWRIPIPRGSKPSKPPGFGVPVTSEAAKRQGRNGLETVPDPWEEQDPEG
jgi:hypothetical protein